MGTEARVRLGLRAPVRPGLPSLDRGSEAWFVSEERRAFPALVLPGADEGSHSLLPGSPPDQLEASLRVFLGTGALTFPCGTLFLGGRLVLVVQWQFVSKVLSCRAESLARSLYESKLKS